MCACLCVCLYPCAPVRTGGGGAPKQAAIFHYNLAMLEIALAALPEQCGAGSGPAVPQERPRPPQPCRQEPGGARGRGVLAASARGERSRAGPEKFLREFVPGSSPGSACCLAGPLPCGRQLVQSGFMFEVFCFVVYFFYLPLLNLILVGFLCVLFMSCARPYPFSRTPDKSASHSLLPSKCVSDSSHRQVIPRHCLLPRTEVAAAREGPRGAPYGAGNCRAASARPGRARWGQSGGAAGSYELWGH